MISINHISKKYGNKTIINNLSLTIYEGEITFIVGSSGAGKSTLLNLIADWIWSAPEKYFIMGKIYR